jgi:hypothetical protein
MSQRTIAIAAVLMAAALTAIFAISPLAYADESETSTDQSVKQKNTGSGNSQNNNCAENLIESFTNDNCQNNNLPRWTGPGPGGDYQVIDKQTSHNCFQSFFSKTHLYYALIILPSSLSLSFLSR